MYNKKYYEENKEKYKMSRQKYYKENKDKIKKYNKQYLLENWDKIYAKQREWQANNKEKFTNACQQSRRRRVERLRSEGVLNPWAVVLYGKEPRYE